MNNCKYHLETKKESGKSFKASRIISSLSNLFPTLPRKEKGRKEKKKKKKQHK